MADDPDPTDGAEAQLADLIRGMWTAITRASRALGHLPVLPGQYVNALQCVTSAGGLTPAQLATAMHLSRPTISELTRRMVDDGYLDRIPSEQDGRSVQLVPTEAARAVLHTFDTGVEQVVGAALGQLNARDRRRIESDVQALTNLRQRLSAVADDAEAAERATDAAGRPA